MTTRIETYLTGIVAAVAAIPGFPAMVETSLLRGFSQEDGSVLVIRPGEELVSNDAPYGKVHRHRELQCITITRGDDAELDAIRLAELFHPVVIGFAAPGILQIQQVGADEPVTAPTDATGALVTLRYRIFYETAEDSLSQ